MDILPDLLPPGLRLVICGTAPGAISAARGAYYAGPGNKFWPSLHAVGLTPRRLAPAEFACLPAFGIGLTDIAKTVSGQDCDLPRQAFDAPRLAASIRAARPAHLAFNGKNAASCFLGIPTGALAYGPGPAIDDFPPITILPSTSGAAARYWDIGPWRALAYRLQNRV